MVYNVHLWVCMHCGALSIDQASTCYDVALAWPILFGVPSLNLSDRVMISKWLGRSKADISLQTHATLIRQKGPLPLQSTFRFEGAYSLFKKAYHIF